MSGMYHRESQSMRPSCAPVPECEELEEIARDVTGSVSMSPMNSSGQGAAADDINNDENVAVAAVAMTTATPVSMGQASPTYEAGVQKSCLSRQHHTDMAGMEASEPHPANEKSFSFTNGAAKGFHAPECAATPDAAATPKPPIAASQSRSISLAPSGVTPEVTAENIAQGSVSVGLRNPGDTPEVASGVVGDRRLSRFASAGVMHSARAESAAPVSQPQQKSPMMRDTSSAEVQQLRYILSRVQTLLPAADLYEDVEAFVAQATRRMATFEGGAAAGGTPDVHAAEPSMAASALTVQQELKRGLGRGKDLMMVRRSAPQATTVSCVSAPAGSQSRSPFRVRSHCSPHVFV